MTPKVPTPAGDLSVVEECAGVVVSGGDGGSGVSAWQGDDCWRIVVVVVSVAELTVIVISPTSDGPNIR